MFGSVTDVRRILGNISTAELRDEDISGYIGDVESEVFIDMGSYIFDNFIMMSKPDGTFNRTLTLYFNIKSGTEPEVYHNGNLLDSSDYQVASDNEIVLSDDLSLSNYDFIIVKYQAKILDTYTNYMAARNIMLTRTINLPDGSAVNTLLQNIKQYCDSLKEKISNKPIVRGWVEHYEDFGIW